MPAFEWASGIWPDWCPGCGNFGILTSVKMALDEMGMDRRRLVVVSGIGCSGKLPHFLKASGVHTLHGRAVPFATGVKVANPDLKVLVHGGDGDMLGIGMGHLIALGRRNADILVVIHSNGVYGLTKGQASPTLKLGLKTKSLAFPNINDAVNPMLIGLTAGYTFLARSYAYNAEHLKGVLIEGLQHRGAGIVEIIQPCPTWNGILNMEWVEKNTRYIKDWDPDVKSEDELLEKTKEVIELESAEVKPLGVIFRNKLKETFSERIASINPTYSTNPPAKQAIEKGGNALPISLEKTFARYLV
jgi:2-oxoglutarate ferredoxin oxidoreductase subunit beta